MDFDGRVAMITGGKRIGAALAASLASRGMDVALTFNRSAADADRAATSVKSRGRRAFAVQADLSRADSCGAAVDAAAEALGRLDVLVNMASVYRRMPLAETTADAWNATIDVDLRSAFLCSQAAIPHMRRAGTGRIVNFTDWVAASGRPRYAGYLPYYVAKRGVIGLTEVLALELAADRILVNAIAPGPILPPEGTTPNEIASVEAATPLGRWGGELEVIKAVEFLIESDFVTGETLRVDGGRHIK